MIIHKFKIGQLVYFYPKGARRVDSAPGPYQITKRLPAGKDGEFRSGLLSSSLTSGVLAN